MRRHGGSNRNSSKQTSTHGDLRGRLRCGVSSSRHPHGDSRTIICGKIISFRTRGSSSNSLTLCSIKLHFLVGCNRMLLGDQSPIQLQVSNQCSQPLETNPYGARTRANQLAPFKQISIRPRQQVVRRLPFCHSSNNSDPSPHSP